MANKEKIIINKNDNIYITAPANYATGGPELLHQLAFNLIKLGFENVFMFYHNFNREGNPVHPEYRFYNIPYVTEIEDNKNNILIAPEVYPNLLLSYRKIRKVMWWLSVDNYYFSLKKPFGFINRVLLKKFNIQKYPFFNSNVKKISYHFVQSEYANTHLQSKRIDINNIYYLSDYLNDNFLKNTYNKNKKENIITYNPNKGFKFTKKIINYCSQKDNNIKFVPIQNMTRDEVINLLKKSKVYIDFGNFPGKDRIPREAAILGCCIITGKKGASFFQKDLPILDKYKFGDKKENLEKISNCLFDCIYNYDKNIINFIPYIKFIKEEKEKFISDLKFIFNKN